jgi:hypothetical protein
MSEIATERLQPAAQVTERVSNEGAQERGPRPRHKPVPARPEPEPADPSETPAHEVDSLA